MGPPPQCSGLYLVIGVHCNSFLWGLIHRLLVRSWACHTTCRGHNIYTHCMNILGKVEKQVEKKEKGKKKENRANVILGHCSRPFKELGECFVEAERKGVFDI